MLTRHWYDKAAVGEALAAVAPASTKDPLRKQKLLFWTYELVLSEEWDYLWGILERVATRWGNSACLKALQLTSRDPTAILHFLHIFLSLPAFAALDPPPADCGLPKGGLPIGLPAKPATWTTHQRATLWWAVQDAAKRRRSLRLLALLGGLSPAVAAVYLDVAMPSGSKGSEKGIYHLLEMAGFPATTASTATPQIKWPDLPVGRVAARLFALPRTLAVTTPTKAPLDPTETKAGCAFWRRIWSAATTAEAEEAVWNTYFPDDIPDEWSAAERAKSHLMS